MNSWLLRAGITGAVIYGTVWVVRKYDVATKATALANHLVVRGVGVANGLLTKYDQATSTGNVADPKPQAEEGPDPKSAYGYYMSPDAR